MEKKKNGYYLEASTDLPSPLHAKWTSFHVVGRIQFPAVVGLGFPAGHTRPSAFLQAGRRGSLLGCTGVS